MSEAPNDALVEPPVRRPVRLLNAGSWLRDLPYGVVLVLTLVGVAYTSFSKHPIVAYWEFLVPVMGVVCIGTGWRHAHDKQARLRLIWTQALHWLAFIVAMNLILLPNVQNMLNSDATGLAILLLLGLGTFVAGVHILSWQVCLLGLIMAFCVPAIAWIEESALIMLLGVIVLVGVGMAFWWIGNNRQVLDRAAQDAN
jgi:hypothetical protein